MSFGIETVAATKRAALEPDNSTESRAILSLHPYFCQIGSIVLPINTSARVLDRLMVQPVVLRTRSYLVLGDQPRGKQFIRPLQSSR